jgi:hypothetical protein
MVMLTSSTSLAPRAARIALVLACLAPAACLTACGADTTSPKTPKAQITSLTLSQQTQMYDDGMPGSVVLTVQTNTGGVASAAQLSALQWAVSPTSAATLRSSGDNYTRQVSSTHAGPGVVQVSVVDPASGKFASLVLQVLDHRGEVGVYTRNPARLPIAVVVNGTTVGTLSQALFVVPSGCDAPNVVRIAFGAFPYHVTARAPAGLRWSFDDTPLTRLCSLHELL